MNSEVVLSWVFYGLAMASIWYLVWEGIFAPSLRLQERIRLFRIRDEVRKRMIEGDGTDVDSLSSLQETINSAISVMPRISLVSMIRFRSELRRNKPLRRAINSKHDGVFASSDPSVKELASRVAKTLTITIAINSGGWIILLVPVLMLGKMWAWLKRMTQKLLTGLTMGAINETGLQRIGALGRQ